jgi:hypothetical protein
MSEEAAALVLARSIARSLLAGSIGPAEATGRAAQLHIRTGYRYDCFHELYVLDDETGYLDLDNRTYLGRTAEAAADDVLAEARRLLADSPHSS